MGKVSPAVVTRITGIWLIGYCAFYYCGPFIAGFLTDYLSYSGEFIPPHVLLDFVRARSVIPRTPLFNCSKVSLHL